jgi:hypothetical protein
MSRYGLLLALCLAGCSASRFSIPDSTPARSLSQAGTVLVSPTMVAPWDEVSASLKPAFSLTGDQAVSQVLPTTEGISEQVLSAFGASLAAGLPTTSTTATTTVGGTSPGTTSTTQSSPGAAPAIANTPPSGASLPAASGSAATLGLDPVLKYKAANFLLQEVQLLNQEIDNAANRSCYVPYVVKLKLAVMNFRPRLPYSAHVHIGFLYNGALASNSRAMVEVPVPPAPSPELARQCQVSDINPAVIPMLVADDVQTALKSRAAEAASQLAVGLSALVHGAGLAANAGSLQESLTAISNHDLTSTLTVGRESESTLYALITPNNQASNQASLVSETYDVAVLLLIPRFYFGGVVDPQSPTISVTTYSEYRDSNSGAILPDGATDALLQQAQRLIPPHLTQAGLMKWNDVLKDPDRLREAKRLADAVKKGSSVNFLNVLGCQTDFALSQLCDGFGKSLFQPQFRFSLWTEMSSLLDYDVDKLALFQAPLPVPIRVGTQQLPLNDDGNNPIQVVIGDVSGRSIAKVGALLKITPFDVKTWTSQAPLTISAQTLTLDPTTHTLTAVFPSLKKLNVTCLSPVEIPSKPKAAPAAPAGAKPPKSAVSQSDATKAPDCPARGADAGTAERPNAVELQLIGCDKSSQLCPSLTETSLPNALGENWLTLKRQSLLRMQALMMRDYSLLPRVQQFKQLSDELKPAEDALKKLVEAQSALAQSPAAQRNYNLDRLKTASDAYEQAWEEALLSAVPLNLDEYLQDHATIGVSLFSSQTSTNPTKVTLSNAGQTVPYDTSGNGPLVVTLVPSVATDTIGVSVTGASLKSVVDSAGTTMAFNAKHGFVLPQAGVYTFNLTALNSNHVVTLSAQALKGDSADGQALTQQFQPTPPVQKPTQTAGQTGSKDTPSQ